MSLAAAAAGTAIGGGSMAHRLDSTGGFIDWRIRGLLSVQSSSVRSYHWMFSRSVLADPRII